MKNKTQKELLKFSAFTLAEVLITLVIVGIIGALTVPSLLNKIDNYHYKVAYRKAYSELSQVLQNSIAVKEFPYRIEKADSNATLQEWEIIKNGFKAQKLCENNNNYDCWVDEERLCVGCGFDTNNGVPSSQGKSFIDISGRTWARYSGNENIYLVDTNGSKKPNHFGKDRWIFTFTNNANVRIESGFPAKVMPYLNRDITTTSVWCSYPPCYYYSWLFSNK